MAKLPILVFGIIVWAALTLGGGASVSAQTTTDNSATPEGTTIITNGLCAGADLSVTGTCASSGISTSAANNQLNHIIKVIIDTLSLIVGIVSVFMIIVGGLRYVTSGGNDSNINSAKNTILYAIIGLVIVALSQFIVRFVLNKLTTS